MHLGIRNRSKLIHPARQPVNIDPKAPVEDHENLNGARITSSLRWFGSKTGNLA